MPFPRHLRTAISQFLLDNSHCPQGFVQHDHISPTSNARSHGHGHTRKARFSTTSSQSLASSREPTHYEVLDVPVTATPAEIKKKFYSLSLRHHPDRNPDDPTASSRFAKINSAYQVLSNNTKRSTYDRDHGIHAHASQSTHSTATPGQHPMGSHSSHASYFGSRPASGLSKRRGVFRGPPPSFYAHGGYGNRRAPPGGAGAAGGGSYSGSAAGAAGGAGKEDDPTSFIDRNRVSHFNARSHYRTQTAEDARRQQRRSRTDADINEQYIGSRGDFAVRFIAVSSILVGAGALSGFIRWPSNTGVEKSAKTKSAKVKSG
ncbi:hypothetical protein ASPSYDRAFT_162965 [Aspergillus sydowii CBS 593.65]|uniref:J domain-containing protein n=1 Tax=Aspergillus sydowii CBS 593.65 TaxID=1036612 RepID=A0A1L9T1C6_9EURO|nr:uncharacterized protein ASPSYDRAFT_162965 [Aspergillus sydowii CBS 593.65]OJJ53141.1 hypothetical protein ASPSYDRAFT_162965 [Aspergillus sydowii CBS 593.65]